MPLLTIVAAIGACAHAPHPSPVAPTVVSEAVGSIVVRHEAEDGDVARQVRTVIPAAVAAAQRWGALRVAVTITIRPTHEALEAAARRPGYPWLRAWARSDSIELQSPRTWSRGAATDQELTELLTHELTHCVMYQAAGGGGRGIPLWFREGMAMTSAGERIAPLAHAERTSLTIGASLYKAEPDLAYATAGRAFQLLVEHHGQARVRRLLATMAAGAEFAEAFQQAMGVSVETFEDEFRTDVRREGTRG